MKTKFDAHIKKLIQLSERNKKIVHLSETKSVSELARKFEISRTRIYQIIEKGMK